MEYTDIGVNKNPLILTHWSKLPTGDPEFKVHLPKLLAAPASLEGHLPSPKFDFLLPIWGFPKMVDFTPISHPKMIIFSRKTHGFVGETHHFRKQPYTQEPLAIPCKMPVDPPDPRIIPLMFFSIRTTIKLRFATLADKSCPASWWLPCTMLPPPKKISRTC